MTTYNDSLSGYCVSYDDTVSVGPLGSSVPKEFPRGNTWMNIDNNIRSKQDCNSFPIFNVASLVAKDGTLLSNWYVNQTERGEINPTSVEQINLKGSSLWNNLSFLDRQKTTTKETTEYAYAGNAQREADGTEFWTYADKPKTTTRETTEYAYAGNAQREADGTEFWSYADKPKTTTRETTEYAYAGNAQRENMAQTQYNQYTGFGGTSAVGGADTYSLRGATLVENWVAPAGRQNLLADAEARQGKIDFGTFGCDQNYNGPGTYQQALPDGSKYQYQYILGEQHINPNKLHAVDDRQIAAYQVEQLNKNPLSIFTTNPSGDIPEFQAFIKPDDFSPVIQQTPIETFKTYKGIDETVKSFQDTAVQVYPTASGVNPSNPNADIVYNMSLDSTEKINPFVVQFNTLNSIPSFSGKAYSGDVDFRWDNHGKAIGASSHKITLGGKDEPTLYGNLQSQTNFLPQMAQGIQNKTLQNRQNSTAAGAVCEGNRALDFSTTM